ncbi:hypothetical protein Tsubulata_015077 [Turnera subulata]|uniref:Uncharacterized protein n=1 Tax=Turnera subulata TaxID=218843 RepID=A0A9Q0JKA9_9ROSI|nr:hypothetical protein Tsubulata_015077 [Turnera subulata]
MFNWFYLWLGVVLGEYGRLLHRGGANGGGSASVRRVAEVVELLPPSSASRLWVVVSAGSGLHCCCGGRVVLFRQCVRQSRGGFLVPGSAVARLGFHPLLIFGAASRFEHKPFDFSVVNACLVKSLKDEKEMEFPLVI